MSYNFALTGAAGYIAPRHMAAIRDTGNRLVGALDPHDSVGILDRYFFEVPYFREFERFDRHLALLAREGERERVHYVSVCSPNYLHDAHVRFALRSGADVVCEKPLVLNPWNCDALSTAEEETGRRVYTVLQLRRHPSVVELYERHRHAAPAEKFEVDLTYITSRGQWYLFSWKGDRAKSGGLATNIGIHFFDMLLWIFGGVESNEVHVDQPTRAAGFLELERARVRWFLSIDRNDLPPEAVEKELTTYRHITVGGEAVEFSGGFTDLHTSVYADILAGGGYGIEDARPSIRLAHDIRHATPEEAPRCVHPFAKPHLP